MLAKITEVELASLGVAVRRKYTYSLKEYRNKFNGKLVMKWVGINSGPLLADTIQEFYVYVEMRYNLNIFEYLRGCTPKQVRTDFIAFYECFEF